MPINPSKTSALATEVGELKNLVNNLPDTVNKPTFEDTGLREEIRHLKKLKVKPNRGPNKKAPEDGKDGRQKSASGRQPSLI